MKRMVVAILAALMVTGCAERINWDNRIGVYTYHQAVSDYGPPTSLATLNDGSKVAQWMTKPGAVVGTPGNVYGPGFYSPRGYYYPYNRPGWPGNSTAYFPAQYLHLEFDASGRLKAWKEISK